jgi:hypothetical protein
VELRQSAQNEITAAKEKAAVDVEAKVAGFGEQVPK